MASKVKVVDSNFRQVEIKVNPGTHLTEVLEQACAKFKADPSKHLLKHKQRQLDLSHTWRTSGLVQGAKLELVVKSNTPTAIDVALQLPPPESEAFPPYGRLTEKLPSDVTIWKLLRHFESGRPSGDKPLNITGRGVPQMESGTGSGQLYYETPVLQVGNRHLATFDDFQKTLSQLGYNSGRVLIRLSFQNTDKTFVDAIADIDKYFQEEKKQTTQEESATSTEATPASPDPTATINNELSTTQSTTSVAEPMSTSTSNQPESTISDPTTTATATPQASAAEDAMDIDSAAPPPPTSSTTAEQTQQPPSSDATAAVRIFAAPTSATPQAALRAAADDETDDAFVPGIEHAKAHQRLLKAAGQNKRLLSDKELADRDAAERKKLSDAASVRIRVRLPDNSLLERDFGQADTGADLYAVVREAMAHPEAPFRLVMPPLGRDAVKDSGEGEGKEGGEGEDNRLIQGYRFRGQVVVTFIWDDAVPVEVRQAPFLKQSAAARAQKVVVPEVPDVVEEHGARAGGGDEKGEFGFGGGEQSSGASKRGLDGLKGKTPKWLKGLGGKK